MSLRRQERERVQQQLEEALSAREETDRVAEAVEEKVGLLRNLRARWDRVHERNNLAQLFDKEWRATN